MTKAGWIHLADVIKQRSVIDLHMFNLGMFLPAFAFIAEKDKK